MPNSAFATAMQQSYTFKGEVLPLGAAMLDGEVYADCPIAIPLKTLNRHGLIAGATGTGKTKTLQVIAENLSDSGVPVLLMDIKGDLSGLAAAAVPKPFIQERYTKLQASFVPQAFPVELLTLGGDPGAQMRATVIEFGPVLLSKVLGLNENQEGLLAILFKYCDDNALPLIDLKDLSTLLQYAQNEGRAEIGSKYGNISSASLGTILRKVIALQQQGADQIFGELSWDVQDLLRSTAEGKGIISILRVTQMQDRPDIFSTYMLQLLVELYQTMPELGDADKPKLVMFIDEAHLIFSNASKELIQQLESIIKLIRSKGVGIYFCTQNPQDVPPSILGQLGLKIQHALRAFTANDRRDIKKTAENYPLSDFYKTEDLLTSLGIGEAIVTVLNEKGVPTQLAHTFMRTPRSRMDVLSPAEIQALVAKSDIAPKYNEEIDSRSAYEIITERLKMPKATSTATAAKTKTTKAEKGWLETAINSSAGRQAQRSIVRGLFGIITKYLK